MIKDGFTGKPGGQPTSEGYAVQQAGPAETPEEVAKEAINTLQDHDDIGPELDARVRMRLGRQLSSFYGELVKEPVPDQFLVLLAELDKREKSA